jgi:hypothetical protein
LFGYRDVGTATRSGGIWLRVRRLTRFSKEEMLKISLRENIVRS